MKRSWAIGLVVLLAAVAGAIYLSRDAHSPSGQPPLVEIDNRTLSNLQAEFNRAASGTRVVLLLSPT